MTHLSSPTAHPLPWHERALVTVNTAATAVSVSRATIYLLAKEGRLSMVKLAGRTLVTVPSLRALLETAQPFQPSGADPRGLARSRAVEKAQRAA